MKAEELTVDVQARITVSDETAERCMRLLEMWLVDNPDRNILCEHHEDGTYSMKIAKWGSDDDPATGS